MSPSWTYHYFSPPGGHFVGQFMGQDNAERRSHAPDDGNKGISKLICFSVLFVNWHRWILSFFFIIRTRICQFSMWKKPSSSRYAQYKFSFLFVSTIDVLCMLFWKCLIGRGSVSERLVWIKRQKMWITSGLILNTMRLNFFRHRMEFVATFLQMVSYRYRKIGSTRPR